jgi:hypothetical protein
MKMVDSPRGLITFQKCGKTFDRGIGPSAATSRVFGLETRLIALVYKNIIQ